MFRRLQLKMTLFFTLVLMGILLVTNLSIYLLLTTYNEYQLSRETEAMLLSIEDFEWVKESESKETDNGLSEPTDVNGIDTTEIDSGEESQTQSDSDDRKHGSSEEKSSDDEEKLLEENKSNEDSESNQIEDEDSDQIKDEDSDQIKDEDSSTNNYNTIGAINPLKWDELIGNVFTMRVYASSTPPTSETTEENEVSLPVISDVIIPSTLSRFSFYMISDMDDQMIKWQNTDERLLDQLFSQNPGLIVGESPRLIIFEESPKVYYLMAKMPIMNGGNQYGTYTIGRDVSAAYETLDNLTRIILISTILGGFIALIGGYIMGGRWIKPIKKAYESKQQFIADASHELRTPISVIMLSSDTLEREISNDEAFQQQIVMDIKDEAKKMGGLVESLLYFARSDNGTYNIRKESMDLSQLIQQYLTSFTYIAESKHIHIISQLEEHLNLQGDSQQLGTIISILLDNAIKYTPDEGTINVTACYVIRKKNEGIQLKVMDNGIGISEEALPYIFDRFYREEGSRSRETGGYGLGLSIAKEIIEKHGGTITVKSEEGLGSSFDVYLPVE